MASKLKCNIICESDEDDFEKILSYEAQQQHQPAKAAATTPINHQPVVVVVSKSNSVADLAAKPTAPPVAEEPAKKYFETELPREAEFSITKEEWSKLKSLQKGHRFLRGEWEDYFIMGMKESNKYCVFAFKDHYVNQSCLRSRRNKKFFSANGYCVFEDCDVKFCLKMSEECRLVVNYTGKLKHCVNEVHARYFRGKSRQELKEILKHTTPMREYLNRIQNADNEQIFAGNADFIGRSTAVYRRIASEAKDVYQSLLLLRLQMIEKTKSTQIPGFIQLVQHIPGCIICFSELQIKLLFNLSSNFTLFVNSTDSMVNTTINGKNLFYHEICVQNPLDPCKNQLLPISCMLTVNNDNELAIKNWLRMILDAQYYAYYAFNTPPSYQINTTSGNIVCNNSYLTIKSLCNELMGRSYLNYLNKCYHVCLSDDKEQKANDDDDDEDKRFFVIHICTKQILNLIKKLCLANYEKINLKFGIYAFSIAVNCRTLDELRQVLYSLFSILESKYLSKKVESLFNFLKEKLKFEANGSNGADYDTFDDELGQFTFNKLNINNDDYTAGNGATNATDAENETEAYYSYEMTLLKQKSKFTQFVQSVYESVKRDVESLSADNSGMKIVNPRYCPKLIECFIDTLAYNIPLWTKIMHEKRGFSEQTNVFTLKMLNERFSLLKALLAHEKDSLDIFLNRLFNENNDLLNELFSNLSFTAEFIKYDIQSATNGQNGASTNGYLTNSILYSTYTTTTASQNNASSSNGNDLIRLNNGRKKRKSEQRASAKKKPRRKKGQELSSDDDEVEEEDEEEEEEGDDEGDEEEVQEEEDEIIIERSAHILSNLFGVDLIKEDLETLESEHMYLSTNVIEFYLKMIEYRANSEQSTPFMYIYPIDFYASLKYGYGAGSKKIDSTLITQLNSEINIFDYKLVLIPVQKSEHWSLGLIDFIKQKITYYDSMLINDYDCLKYLMDFLDREFNKQTQTKFDSRSWKISNEKNIPKQNRNKDCGVFMLFYAKCLASLQEINSFTTKDVENFRGQLKDEILQQIISHN